MKIPFILPILLGSLFLFSCRDDRILSESNLNLRFSTDTVLLDTVFNGVNSSTYTLKVFNDSEDPISISRVFMENSSTAFRLNVNGIAANQVENVQIEPEDSIYVFIEVSADSALGGCGSGDSYLCEDRIVFADSKGLTDHVTLVTEVRDAIFHFPNKFIAGGGTVIPYSRISGNETWTPGRPHVVYGYVVVDSGATLNIMPGTNVHFHANSGMWVFNNATLNIAQGAQPGVGDSVTFQGDRLEPAFENLPGQWGGPLGGLFVDGGARVKINNAVIKNANNALRTDSALNSEQLEITNSYILNSSRTALLGGYGNVTARNVVLANSGLFLFYGLGGNYDFRHCTFANYWRGSTRSDPAVLLTNFFEFRDENGDVQRLVRDVESAYFGNCIIDGNARQEFATAKDEAGLLNFSLNSALLKVENDPEDRGFDLGDGSKFQNILVNQLPEFVNPNGNNYRLDTTSQVIDAGNIQDGLILPVDIVGNNRNFNGRPDLGAFERQF